MQEQEPSLLVEQELASSLQVRASASEMVVPEAKQVLSSWPVQEEQA